MTTVQLLKQKAATVPLTIKRKASPMPANVAAIWGAFLYEGLLNHTADLQRGAEILRRWSQGCDALMAEACAYLPEVWRQIESRWYEKDFPGVFEYQVLAPLGVYIGDYLLVNNGELPLHTEVCEVVRDLIADFFRVEKHNDGGVYA